MKMFVRGAMIGLLFASFSQAASVGPTPYLSAADSPWNSVSFSSFFLEDFEDGLLNTPDVSQVGATDVPAAGGQFNDSVDSDDGAIDGFGTAGRSHYTTSGTTGITYTFGIATLGRLPTHAGVVWTDLTGAADVFLEAFDQNNISLGILAAGALNDGVQPAKPRRTAFSVGKISEESRAFGFIRAPRIWNSTISSMALPFQNQRPSVWPWRQWSCASAVGPNPTLSCDPLKSISASPVSMSPVFA